MKIKSQIDKTVTENSKPDWKDFPTRERNTLIATLVEGDILVDGDIFSHVASGEINIYADGKIDYTTGELIEVSVEAVSEAISKGSEIFNMEDVG